MEMGIRVWGPGGDGGQLILGYHSYSEHKNDVETYRFARENSEIGKRYHRAQWLGLACRAASE